MAAQSNGGKRLSAGRPKVTDVQLTARVSSAASKTIKAHGLDGGIAAGVRHMGLVALQGLPMNASTGRNSFDKQACPVSQDDQSA